MVILVCFNDVFVCRIKGNATLSIVTQNSLLVLRLLRECDPLVIALEGLDIVLGYELHGSIHVQVNRVAEVKIAENHLDVVGLPVVLEHVGASLVDEGVFNDGLQLTTSLLIAARA